MVYFLFGEGEPKLIMEKTNERHNYKHERLSCVLIKDDATNINFVHSKAQQNSHLPFSTLPSNPSKTPTLSVASPKAPHNKAENYTQEAPKFNENGRTAQVKNATNNSNHQDNDVFNKTTGTFISWASLQASWKKTNIVTRISASKTPLKKRIEPIISRTNSSQQQQQ